MLLAVLVIALALTTLSTPLLNRLLGRAAGWPIAAVFAALTVVVAAQGHHVLVEGGTLEFSRPWMPAIGVNLELRMDGLGWLFTMLVLAVGALIIAYSTRYFPPGRRGGFYFLMTAFATAMAGLVLADDLVLLFVFWELTTICSFYLIGLSGPSANRPAVRTFIVTALGGLALLTAVVLLIVRTGTSSLSAVLSDTSWMQDSGFATVIALLVMLAVFTKSAQFPFHYWLPDAMAASTPVSAYLHAATMVKAGVYVAMRFSAAFGEFGVWNIGLISVGLLTALIGAVFALQRHDLKELAAYSTVSQLGFLIMVIGIGTPAALIAAAVHTVAHALFKSALFMTVGVIDRQAGTRDIRRLSGLRSAMPVTAIVASLAALSMAGIPPFLGFVSKETLFDALLEAPGPAWVGPAVGVGAVIAAAFTFAYAFRFVVGVFGGPPNESSPREAGVWFLAAPAVAVVGGLVLGLGAPWLNPLADRVAVDAAPGSGHAYLSLWHGFNAALLMSAVAIGLGALLAWRSAAGEALAGRRFLPVSGTAVFEMLHRGVIALGVRVGDLTRGDSPARHMAMPIVLIGVLTAVVAAANLDFESFTAPTSRRLDWFLVVLVVAAVLAATITRSRLAGLVLVGVAGFTVALWFLFLGAFDVALTQVMVEILTVVVAVLVLRRLPRRFHRATRRRTVLTAAIAIGAGLSAGLAAYLMTGRRELSQAAEYFLSQVEEDTGGTNVVNTILVDYRAMDTMGELTVLGVAGLVIISVLNSSGLISGGGERQPKVPPSSAVWNADDNTVIVRTVARWLMPLLVLWSLYLLFRGHHEPGGGFIAGLVGGAGFALVYLTAASESAARIRLSSPGLIASGIVVAAGSGLLGYFDGSLLRPLHADIWMPWGDFHFTTALVFDVGVYLAVIGVLLTALNQLGPQQPRSAGVRSGPRGRGGSRRRRAATGRSSNGPATGGLR
ncbi:multicomponent Na+:H+ antiporter subunit A [Actinoalloteichus hoggarensis]|uniref:Na(+)/H(+) antiporter subunit A n=1 Tax=Actinoalloteichus hoggarensis TaxID=1470176 RepID=A0A221W8H7_9PSEU|nr:DUF4040 family protein [Actinoalloteichus hoggarensis]ASO21647.1 Na(+)/H(+) antiporter subunit A [Actinoalloteichus hoggarensis]MBB5922240.1 multicomponent Na+:H+ antiporter subunit A [Actinoalloteichus hoggarensis]